MSEMSKDIIKEKKQRKRKAITDARKKINKKSAQEKHAPTIKGTKCGQEFKQFLECNKIDSIGPGEEYSLTSVGIVTVNSKEGIFVKPLGQVMNKTYKLIIMQISTLFISFLIGRTIKI